jgi:hypothetical protein
MPFMTLVAAALALAAGRPSEANGPAPAAAVSELAALRVAILPIDNLSEAAAPLAEIRGELRDALASRRVVVLAEDDLENFMRRHRMRDTSGLAREMGRALREETGAGAVLVTSLDLYVESSPPKLALTSRLVSTGDDVRILWMDSAGRAGDEDPGFLGLGSIEDPLVLRDLVLARLADSLAESLSGAGERPARGERHDRPARRFRPRSYYRSAPVSAEGKSRLRVAVLPFSNDSTFPRAGEIVTLQIVRALADSHQVEIVEPGIVREALLNARLIQEEGLSTPQSKLLRALLEVDVVIFGEVSDYVEASGGREPEVDFLVRAVDTSRLQVMWSSTSHGRGDDDVFFFGVGSVPTAHRLASEMARALVETILPAIGGAP